MTSLMRSAQSTSRKHFWVKAGVGLVGELIILASTSIWTLYAGDSNASSHLYSAYLKSSQVVTGNAVISSTAASVTSGAVMNINQSSNKAVINWNTFNVGSNATVNFNTPGANATTLNRVVGVSRSMIDGAAYKSLIESKRAIELSNSLIVIPTGSVGQFNHSIANNSGTVSANLITNIGGVIELVLDKVDQPAASGYGRQAPKSGNSR